MNPFCLNGCRLHRPEEGARDRKVIGTFFAWPRARRVGTLGRIEYSEDDDD